MVEPGNTQPILVKAGRALLHWLRATAFDALLVGILWLIGLLLLHVPLAPLWALVGALAQFIPNVGGMLALIGPALSLLFAGRNWEQFGLLLCLYAAIVFIDQLFLQPWLMKRNAKVPIWASIFGPHRSRHPHSVLGSFIGSATTGSRVCFSPVEAAATAVSARAKI